MPANNCSRCQLQAKDPRPKSCRHLLLCEKTYEVTVTEIEASDFDTLFGDCSKKEMSVLDFWATVPGALD